MQVIGSANFTDKIASYLGVAQIPITIQKFNCGEYLAKLHDSIDSDIIVVGSIVSNDNLMEILSIIDAIKSANAKDITLIAPYIAYSRQDVMQHPFSSVGIKIIANILEASGVKRLITADIHSEEALNFFRMDVTHIKISDILAFYSDKLALDRYTIVAPDAGCKERLGDVVHLSKTRNYNGAVEVKFYGDVRGQDCIIVDDIWDSGSTMIAAINCLRENGAQDVKAYVTHYIGASIRAPVALYTTDSATLITNGNFSAEILSISPVICQFL